MFKIVESINKDPVRFPIKPGVKLTPGHIVKIVQHEKDLVIDICDGRNAFGLLGNRCVGGNDVDLTKKGKVFLQRMVVDVDKFDRKNPIDIGSSLYCSVRGVLSSKKPFDDAVVLAKVISPATTEKKHMQILWL